MNNFDILKFLDDQKIDYKTAGHKHCRAGWVQVKCPFCTGNPGWHLGINIENGYWLLCWRCGKKKLWDWLKAVLGTSPGFLKETIARYGVASKNPVHTKFEAKHADLLKWPGGIVEKIPERAIKYLQSRGYDAERLIRVWGLKFTGPSGPYKFRIIAPIYYKGRLVSYQGRDYSGKSDLRYKACRKDDEVKDHQECLYGDWLITGKRAVVVEGVPDAWRMGRGAVGVFGIAYTMKQVIELSKYDYLALMFDGGEVQAEEQRDRLMFDLKTLKPSIEIETIDLEGGDPGEMSQDDADHLMSEILGKSRI